MSVRGVRGATVAACDEPTAIWAATRELLAAILSANPTMTTVDLASVWFSATHDLTSAYPAAAARQMGWTEVPLMCLQEMEVTGSLPRCIRVLLHWNTELPQEAVHHVFLGEAAGLRPDLARTIQST